MKNYMKMLSVATILAFTFSATSCFGDISFKSKNGKKSEFKIKFKDDKGKGHGHHDNGKKKGHSKAHHDSHGKGHKKGHGKHGHKK